MFRRIRKLLTVAQLRAPYHFRVIDAQGLARKHGLELDNALDLGSGPTPKNLLGARQVRGVDIRSYEQNENVLPCRIGSEVLPFKDNAFSVVTAHDVLEHLPRVAFTDNGEQFPFVCAMNEVWRVLKVGGVFYSTTPCYPMKEAFQDPTHVNFMTEDTLTLYFGEPAWARIYGYVGSFEVIEEGWQGSHYFCMLKKTSAAAHHDIDGLQRAP